jgi:hypothetical protein
MLSHVSTYELLLIGDGTKPSNRHGPIPSHYIGRCSLRLPFRGGGARPLGLAVRFGVDCPVPWWTGSFMDNPVFIGLSLSDVRVMMAIMHSLIVELSC